MSLQHPIETKDETPVTVPYWTLVIISGAAKALLDIGAGTKDQRATIKLARMTAHHEVDKQIAQKD